MTKHVLKHTGDFGGLSHMCDLIARILVVD